jgi:hypothetical protein
MDSLYTEKPDGLCGNDDCGQMSAWYVMSAMGFYQVCPGQPQYALGSPLFDKTVIHFENGNEFTIRAENNSGANKYIQSAGLNGRPYPASYLAHEEMMKGGKLELQMADTPNREWAPADENIPHSLRAVSMPFPGSARRERCSPIPCAWTSVLWIRQAGSIIVSTQEARPRRIALRRLLFSRRQRQSPRGP